MMFADWSEYTRLFTALFVILDPFAVIPIFLSLTEAYSPRIRARTVSITTITVIIVLIVSALIGEQLLHWMGTSFASFRVGGGLVLLLMALALLQGKPDMVRAMPEESEIASHKSSVAVVPLAIPLLAGPGAMSTVIVAMDRSEAELHWLGVITCIVLVCLVLWLILRSADAVGRVLGEFGLNIINRVFGLILAAIAVEMMANGIKQLFPVL